MSEETLIREKSEKIERIKSENLFYKSLRRFLRESTEIIDLAEKNLTDADSVINDDKRLRVYAHEFVLLDVIDSIKKKIEANPSNFDEATKEVAEILRNLQLENPQLAKLIANEKLHILQEIELLRQISFLANDAEKAKANIDVLIESAQKIQNGGIREKLVKRLLIIRRCVEEINSLHKYGEDVKSWSHQAHPDISYYTNRVNSYFIGSPSENQAPKGLDEFKDILLKQQIYGNREIKRLFYIAGFTYKADEQLRYISALISFLQQDISGEVWIRNIATSKFVANVDKHAAAFQKSFGNKYFAQVMLRNKGVLGEQPFKWIELLTKMKETIEAMMPRKNAAIENAKSFLIVAFTNRRKQLEISITSLLTQIQTILKEFETAKDIIDLINKSIKRLRRIINRIWGERRDKFNRAKLQINATKLKEKIILLAQRTDIIKDSDSRIAKIKAFRIFQTHIKILGSRKTISEDDLSPLFMVDFDLARMKDLAEGVIIIENRIREKNVILRDELVQLKENIKVFLSRFELLLQWLNSIKLKIPTLELNVVRNRLAKFRGDYYG